MKNTMKKAMAAVMVMAAMLLAMPGTDAQAATMRISKTSMTLKIGKSKTLKMKNATGKVKWKTSKKSVATVTQKGKVTAKKAGKAFIQAKVSGRTYECRVTVKGAAKKTDTGNAVSTDTNAAGTGNTDVTNTNTNKDSANTDTSVTDTQTTTEDTQPDKTETTPVHEHDWVPHYSYNANGKPRKDAMFCSDVTCPYNNGYGTDNGWRGESLTDNTGTETTEPSQGTSVQQPAAPVTDNSNTGTQDTVATEPSVTEPAVTETPVQDEQTKEHHHAWTIPVLSDDKLTVVGYACACGETSHVHTWDIVHKVESGFSAGAVDGWECSKCGETINTADYEELTKSNNAASETIKQTWVAKNITANMTELEKVKAILNELHFWHYGSVPGLPTNISRTTMCGGANKAFVEYCAAVGIRAEQVDASKELHVPDHYIAYVWIDGEQYVADATPESHGLMGTQDIVWTMDGYDLYLDYLDGIVTDEEFDQYMPGYER